MRDDASQQDDSTRLLSFYRDRGRDHANRALVDLLAFDDRQLEHTHDYIQWLFPLPERSPYNTSAPLLGREAIDAFASELPLRQRLLDSFKLMLRFYGMTLVCASGRAEVRRTEHFDARANDWLMPDDHNHLRITRILRCLSLCGLGSEARAFLSCLKHIVAERPSAVTPESMRYWEEALPPSP